MRNTNTKAFTFKNLKSHQLNTDSFLSSNTGDYVKCRTNSLSQKAAATSRIQKKKKNNELPMREKLRKHNASGACLESWNNSN